MMVSSYRGYMLHVALVAVLLMVTSKTVSKLSVPKL